MLISQNKKQLVLNSLIELGDDLTVEKKGKGRKFVSRFIEPGIVHYEEFGDVLITKETIDKFINSLIGCPIIIQHKDITDKNADQERVGVISNVWYNETDGWYYCEGVIWNKQAIDLVKNQGWNVSCTYDFISDNQEKTHNGKKIDLEFIDGNFLHLALVPNPRYERANIVINSKDEAVNEQGSITQNVYDEIAKNTDNKAQNRKDFTIMAVLNDLENFIKSIVNNDCDKDKKEEKVENIDKRKIIDEIGGILKGKVSEEIWRTIIGKIEQLSYHPSETDKADNKCKNEDEEEKEIKKEKFEEEKEIADNKKAKNEDKEENKKVENSMEDIRSKIMGGSVQLPSKASYISQADRLKAGEEY